MNVIKRNKRLFIVGDEVGNVVYSPPDFVHIQSRDQLQALAKAIAEQGYIDAVTAFEAKCTRR